MALFTIKSGDPDWITTGDYEEFTGNSESTLKYVRNILDKLPEKDQIELHIKKELED